MRTALSVRVTPEQAAWLESQIGGFRKIADVVRDCIDAQRLQTPKALDTAATLGAPPPGGAPLYSYFKRVTPIDNLDSLVDSSQVTNSKCINIKPTTTCCGTAQSQGEKPAGRKRRRSTGTQVGKADGPGYSDEFMRFWRQYLATERRASGQSKPKAFEAWSKVVPKLASADALQACLLAAIQDQRRIERQGGFATPFPDAFRWLRDGRWESFLVSGASDAPEAPSRPAQGPLSDDPF